MGLGQDLGWLVVVLGSVCASRDPVTKQFWFHVLAESLVTRLSAWELLSGKCSEGTNRKPIKSWCPCNIPQSPLKSGRPL